MAVYKIIKREGSTLGGKTRFAIIDCDCGSVAELIARAEAGFVLGDLLSTQPTGTPHVYSVTRRQPVAFRADDISRAEVPRAEYVEDCAP